MSRSFVNGTIINYWTIIGIDKEKRKYITECICGKVSLASSATLKSGRSKSCGCKQKESVAERIIKSNFQSIRKRIFANYIKAAKRRKYAFSLTFEIFSEIILMNCVYCGIGPTMVYKYGRGQQALDYNMFKYNGVDRKDNTVGYIENNCVPCCKICNNAKSTLSIEEWEVWIKRVYKHRFN